MATLHEFVRNGSKANKDISVLLSDSKARIRVVYEFRPWYKLDGWCCGGVVLLRMQEALRKAGVRGLLCSYFSLRLPC